MQEIKKELKKLTITKTTSRDKKKDGTPLINKWGKPYVLAGIQCQEYGSQWLNGFLNFPPTDWVGQVKELEVWKEEYQGQEQLKFGFPRTFKLTEEMWKELLGRVAKLEFDKIPDTEPIGDDIQYPEENNNPENIPF